jgi:hypothetical protein
MEYNWKINKMQVAQDNLVIKVDLTVTGTDGDLSASAAYTRTLSRGDSFVPYEQLTEQQVIDWCFGPETIVWDGPQGQPQLGQTLQDMPQAEQQSFVRHLKDEGEAQVADQIARQLAKKAAEPALPWATQPE